MKTQKDDRRSQRTRQLLHHALFELMQEKRYESITVQDIIDRANVGRSTFYAHFTDKEDLATSNLEQILDALSQFELSEPGDRRVISTRELFQHVQDQYSLFQTLMQGRGLDLFFEKAQTYWSKKVEACLHSLLPNPAEKPAVPLPVLSSYMAGAFFTLLKWWFDNKMPYPPEKMDEIFQQLVMPGVWQVLKIR